MSARHGFARVLTGLAVLAPPLVIFVFPALSLVSRNIDYFPTGHRAAAPLLFAALGWLVAGAGAGAAHGTRVPRAVFVAYVLSTPIWFVHTLAVQLWDSLLATGSVGLFWMGLTAFAYRQRLSTVLQYCGVAAAILLVGAVMNTFSAAQTAAYQPDERQEAEESNPRTDLPNIYHLVFDEYQTEFFEYLLDEDLRDELAGFHFYPDTVATYGRTEMTLASTYNSSGYDYRSAPIEYLEGAFQDPESPIRTLRSLGYDTTGYLHRVGYFAGDPPLDRYDLHDEGAAIASLPGYRNLVVSLWTFSHAPTSLSRRVLPSHHYEQLIGESFLPEDAPPRSVMAMRTLIARERLLPDRGRYTLAHLILPHFPDVLDEDCEYTPGLTTGPVEQAACTNSLIVQFVRVLRDLGRLEDSVVIIGADHGNWYDIVDGEIRSLRDDGLFGERASWARSRALLLARLPDQSRSDDEFVVSDRQTTTDDILPAVFTAIGVPYEFGGDRRPLQELVEERTRYYHFYSKATPLPEIVDGTITRYTIERRRARVDAEIPVPSAAER